MAAVIPTDITEQIRFLENQLDDLRKRVISAETLFRTDGTEVFVKLADVERSHIYHVIRFCNGNKSEAARVLDVDRRTLYRKLERYEKTG